MTSPDYHSKFLSVRDIFANLKAGDNTIEKALQNKVGETLLHNRISSGLPSQSPACGTKICQEATLDYKHLTTDCFKRNHLIFLILIINNPLFLRFRLDKESTFF